MNLKETIKIKIDKTLQFYYKNQRQNAGLKQNEIFGLKSNILYNKG